MAEGVIVHCLPLPPDEVTVHEGIAVTTIPRTIFDLAPLGERAVKQAMAKAEYLKLTDPLSLAALVERYGSRKHVGVIANALRDYEAGKGVTANELEDAFDEFLESRDLPTPERNAWIQLGTRWIKGDFVWRVNPRTAPKIEQSKDAGPKAGSARRVPEDAGMRRFAGAAPTAELHG